MRIMGVVLAAVVAAAGTSAYAQLSEQESAELRQRAPEFQNERSRNPDFQPGQGRSAAPADATAKPAARTGKSRKAAKKEKETGREKVANKVRSIRKVPGAFVRRR